MRIPPINWRPTTFRHLFDLVEEGLAHLIRLDELRNPEQMPPEKLTPTCIPRERLFGAESLTDTLRKHVMGDSSSSTMFDDVTSP